MAVLDSLTDHGVLVACKSTANQTAWAIASQLKTDKTKGWCVDSSGKSKQISIAGTAQANLSAELSNGACVD